MHLTSGAGVQRAVPGVDFALGAAQRHLFAGSFDFTLRSRDAPRLEVRIRIVPLATSGHNAMIVGHHRTVTMLRDGQQTTSASSTVRVDLSSRSLVSLDVEGLDGEVRNAASLPRIARHGDGGHYFDHVVRPAGMPAAALAPSTVNWTLEPWDDDHKALWCLHVVHPSGTGIVSTEGYVIDREGGIVGAVLRAQVPPARPAGDDVAGGSRVVELRSIEDAR